MHTRLMRKVCHLLDENWKQSDAFFFDNPDIADKYGFVTCYKGEPIGFICWDPRNRPEYVRDRA